jgi:hypothetical protein
VNNVQFIHLASCGGKPGRGQPAYATINGVIAEAVRAPRNAPHVAFPDEPAQIFGIDPLEVAHQATELLRLAKDSRGRRLRSSCVSLIAGVATYPIPKSEMGGFVSDRDFYHLWEQQTLEFLQQEHGDALKCVLRHEDETHLHLHFYILPVLTMDGRLDFLHAHPGRYARADAVEREACSAARDAAYTNATVAYQDRYHLDVSRWFGHERVGPRRKRVDRARHKANRAAVEHVERMRAEFEMNYRVQVSESEANERSRRVSDVHFIAVAAEREQGLRAEIDRLLADKERLEAEVRHLRLAGQKHEVEEVHIVPDVDPLTRQNLMESLAWLTELEPQPVEDAASNTCNEGPDDEVERGTALGFPP